MCSVDVKPDNWRDPSGSSRFSHSGPVSCPARVPARYRVVNIRVLAGLTSGLTDMTYNVFGGTFNLAQTTGGNVWGDEGN